MSRSQNGADVILLAGSKGDTVATAPFVLTVGFDNFRSNGGSGKCPLGSKCRCHGAGDGNEGVVRRRGTLLHVDTSFRFQSMSSKRIWCRNHNKTVFFRPEVDR